MTVGEMTWHMVAVVRCRLGLAMTWHDALAAAVCVGYSEMEGLACADWHWLRRCLASALGRAGAGCPAQRGMLRLRSDER